jgi:hypothetical protein
MRKEIRVSHNAPEHVGHMRSVTSMHRPDHFTKDRYDDRADFFLSGQLHATVTVGREEGRKGTEIETEIEIAKEKEGVKASP